MGLASRPQSPPLDVKSVITIICNRNCSSPFCQFKHTRLQSCMQSTARDAPQYKQSQWLRHVREALCISLVSASEETIRCSGSISRRDGLWCSRRVKPGADESLRPRVHDQMLRSTYVRGQAPLAVDKVCIVCLQVPAGRSGSPTVEPAAQKHTDTGNSLAVGDFTAATPLSQALEPPAAGGSTGHRQQRQ